MTDKADLNKLLDDWRDPYGARTVTLASDLIDALLRERHNFVEQTENAADKCNFNSSKHRMPDPKAAYYVGIDDLMQAIKDKFK